ncbi:hypothetical protein KY289_017802 [Solanum tuberosum]|nr:hypothetical protein KY289_017802 [Solanum tuberosum]
MESTEEISYVSQQEAIEIDQMFMGPLGFTVDQLMELAGLSVASAIGEVSALMAYWYNIVPLVAPDSMFSTLPPVGKQYF